MSFKAFSVPTQLVAQFGLNQSNEEKTRSTPAEDKTYVMRAG